MSPINMKYDMQCNENRNLSALLKDRIIAGIPQHRHNIRWDEMFSGFAVVISCKNCGTQK